MQKKEIQKERAQLLKEIEAEQKKLKAAEHKLSLYEYQELEKSKKDAQPNKKTQTKKKPSKKSAVKSKPIENKKAKSDNGPVEGATRQNMKKHIIVPASELEHYDFEQRKKDWHVKSGINKKQEVCSICGDDDNWESILLDNKKHVCYYCWIKKPENFDSKKDKEKESKSDKSKYKNENQNARAIEPKKEEATDNSLDKSSKPVGKLFYIVSIVLGILLVALIIIIVLGIVSNWTFKF